MGHHRKDGLLFGPGSCTRGFFLYVCWWGYLSGESLQSEIPVGYLSEKSLQQEIPMGYLSEKSLQQEIPMG